MKTNFLKSTLKFAVMALIASTMMVACDNEEEEEPIVLDGFYISGDATALDKLDTKGRLAVTRNEVTQTDRNELSEIYIALKGGETFTITEVAGSTKTVLGPGTDFAMVPEAELDNDEPKEGLWRGSFVESETGFTVPEDGLYHVALDSEVEIIVIALVKWGLIGGATPGGWSDNTEMTATFDLEKMTFMVENVTMLENEFKFRYSNGWKIILDANYDLGGGQTGIKVNTNFGGSVSDLVPGGGNIANTEYAVYKFEMTWELGVGTSAVMTKTGEAEPLPEYPEELYMIGAAIGGWDWAVNGIQMVPVHSHPHLFWKIVWIESGVQVAGVKFAPAKEWVGDFGVNAGAGATDGVWAKGGDNLPDVAASGYYMVVVNLLDETIEVNPPKVHGIGDAFGTWDAAQAATLFTVDNTNKVVVSPAFVADAELRMHVAANTLTNADGNAVDWWQAEFIVLEGVIEYRGTGNDQARVNVTTGQTVTLDFTNETGTIQ
ncbi:MAG: SusF/SusE family outer membrane protein [Bacteroidales bacterium]|nr:SusF/SusE family outer membrane protein [Bacteroidales bacterium]MBN2699041.1 SusF/SusE family outer membrane protein [Bacteroidales bacterium]